MVAAADIPRRLETAARIADSKRSGCPSAEIFAGNDAGEVAVRGNWPSNPIKDEKYCEPHVPPSPPRQAGEGVAAQQSDQIELAPARRLLKGRSSEASIPFHRRRGIEKLSCVHLMQRLSIKLADHQTPAVPPLLLPRPSPPRPANRRESSRSIATQGRGATRPTSSQPGRHGRQKAPNGQAAKSPAADPTSRRQGRPDLLPPRHLDGQEEDPRDPNHGAEIRHNRAY
jgi:hypothetical protein